ncbi:MAG: ferrous iron transporter B, partial [Chlorobi bacterium]|nr:ferrous iron transporter B [Chlorobiota bacterium]
AILFFLITLLEDTGYLSRMSVLSDSLFRKLGMEGLSIVPLLSGFACAVPAIMSTRIIKNKRRRLITMFVTPLTSCSARLPVYLLIVGILVPNVYVGPVQLQGLVLFGIYMFSILAVLVSAWIVNKIVPAKDDKPIGSIIELPDYQIPSLRNALYSTWLKVLIFIKGVTKIIIVMTIILWILGNISIHQFSTLADGKLEYVEPASVEESLLGHIGKAIQPVFEPIGYDWKITVGILSSFAAREVFVSTMASLYGLMDESAIEHLHDFLAHDEAITTPVLLSLLVFYIFAMLCMSTLAIMKHEAGWKMVLWEIAYTWTLAYLFAFIVYRASSHFLV